MSMQVFKKALKIVQNDNGILEIGGGEPTLHPHFWSIIGQSLAANLENIWMATNGSKTEMAISLANMAKKGIISVRLSQDKYHPPIDKKVVNAFKKDYSNSNSNDFRSITGSISSPILKSGRAEENEIYSEEDCACEVWFIDPYGNFKQCGCLDSPILCNIMDVSIDHIDQLMESLTNRESCCWKEEVRV